MEAISALIGSNSPIFPQEDKPIMTKINAANLRVVFMLSLQLYKRLVFILQQILKLLHERRSLYIKGTQAFQMRIFYLAINQLIAGIL